MRRFPWKSPGSGADRGWHQIRGMWYADQSIREGGLGVLNLLTVKSVLLSNWLSKIMNHVGELVLKVLKDSYGTRLYWDECAAKVEGASAF